MDVLRLCVFGNARLRALTLHLAAFAGIHSRPYPSLCTRECSCTPRPKAGWPPYVAVDWTCTPSPEGTRGYQVEVRPIKAVEQPTHVNRRPLGLERFGSSQPVGSWHVISASKQATWDTEFCQQPSALILFVHILPSHLSVLFFYFLLREPQNNDLGASNGSCPTTVVISTRRKKSSSTLLGLDGFDQLARKS